MDYCTSQHRRERKMKISSNVDAVGIHLAMLVVIAQCQNAPPVLDLDTGSTLSLNGPRVSFFEQDGSTMSVFAETTQNITDSDSSIIVRVTVRLLQRPDEERGFEQLQLNLSRLPIGIRAAIDTNNYFSGTLTLTGTFTFEQCLDLLRAVEYFNNSTNPDDSVLRVILFRVQDDSGASSNEPSVQLVVVPYNNSPQLFLGGAEVMDYNTTFMVGRGCVQVVSESMRLIDPDSIANGIQYVQLTPESSTWNGSVERLSSPFLSAMPPNQYFLNLTVIADYEANLPEIVYCNSAEEPHAGVRTLTVTALDGGSTTAGGALLPAALSQPAFSFINIVNTNVPTAGISGCADSNGGCEHTCVNTEDGHRCECRPGHQLVNGFNCSVLAGCPPETSLPLIPGSGVMYNWTGAAAGSTQHVPCRGLEACQERASTAGGTVARDCILVDGLAEWLPADFSGCGLSITALQVCEASQQIESDIELAAMTIVNITASAPDLEISAITVTTSIVEDLTTAAIDQPEVRGNYLGLIDNLLDASPANILESQRLANTSTRIFQSLRRFVNMVPMPENSTNDTLAFALDNFAILLQDVDPRNFSGEAFSINLGPVQEAINNTTGIDEEHLLTMMAPLPNATASAELPESLFNTSTPGDPGPRRRVIFSVFLTNTLFLTPETACSNSTIGSVVLGVGVNTSVPNVRLSSGRIRLVFQQYREPCEDPVPAESTAMCANFARNGRYGRWNTDNCRVVSDDGATTHCDCTQLGHFGLLFDLNPGEVFPPGAIVLTVVTYIGTFISVFCLLVIMVTYTASQKLHSSERSSGLHGQLLINLSCSLIGLYILFIVAGHVTTVPPLCGVVAAVLQYFMLVFFGWTAAEACFLYQRLVRNVLGQASPHFVLVAAAIVWLVPAVIVGISAGAGHNHYVNPFYCRAVDYPFWFGMILPFGAIYLFNWTIFIIIMTCLLRDMHRKQKDLLSKESKKRKLKKNFFLALGLSLVFGLGWGFGLLATTSNVQELAFTFQIIFSVFVGSQGLLLFFFHVIRAPQVRKQWKRWLIKLCCRKPSKYVLTSPPMSPLNSHHMSSSGEQNSVPSPTEGTQEAVSTSDCPLSVADISSTTATTQAVGSQPSTAPLTSLKETSHPSNGTVLRET